MDNENITTYLALIAAAFAASTENNIDAIDEFEDAHPGIADAAYQAAGPMSYEIISGVVTPR